MQCPPHHRSGKQGAVKYVKHAPHPWENLSGIFDSRAPFQQAFYKISKRSHHTQYRPSGCAEEYWHMVARIGERIAPPTEQTANYRGQCDAAEQSFPTLGDTAEAERLLNEAARHLNEAATKPDADQRDLTKQRAALSEQRMRQAGTERGIAATVRELS